MELTFLHLLIIIATIAVAIGGGLYAARSVKTAENNIKHTFKHTGGSIRLPGACRSCYTAIMELFCFQIVPGAGFWGLNRSGAIINLKKE